MHEYDYAKLLGRIREKGLTQEDLAKKMPVAPSTLNLSLSNKRNFKQNEITRICELLSIGETEIPQYFFAHKLLKIEETA